MRRRTSETAEGQNRQLCGAERARSICNAGSPLSRDDRISTAYTARQVLARQLRRSNPCSRSPAHGANSSPPSGELSTPRCSGCGPIQPYNSFYLLFVIGGKVSPSSAELACAPLAGQSSQLPNPRILTVTVGMGQRHLPGSQHSPKVSLLKPLAGNTQQPLSRDLIASSRRSSSRTSVTS